MSSRIIETDWVVPHITKTIQALRVVKVRNDCVRLHKVVDIRRNRRFLAKKDDKVLVQSSFCLV